MFSGYWNVLYKIIEFFIFIGWFKIGICIVVIMVVINMFIINLSL